MTTTSTPQVNPVAQIRALHDRLLRAEALVADGKVHPVIEMSDHYIVESSKGYYLVNDECTCPDFTTRTDLIKTYCKHRLAALVYADQQVQADQLKATRKSEAESPKKDEELERKVSDLYN
jgi:predicted nucleic acid-binding Zn finger protein